jgi:CTP synthase (UTP-ammonia lyase)
MSVLLVLSARFGQTVGEIDSAPLFETNRDVGQTLSRFLSAFLVPTNSGAALVPNSPTGKVDMVPLLLSS